MRRAWDWVRLWWGRPRARPFTAPSPLLDSRELDDADLFADRTVLADADRRDP